MDLIWIDCISIDGFIYLCEQEQYASGYAYKKYDSHSSNKY